eukprot:TRINITY_DN4091_c0_g1_i1.p1 TRINITY_DN4091_c0_g1~~TRINITY_DN4091_c0_g1_i1.p1  ORF type:complete len:162 (-),score=30.85 TRINITY_DN4091_c0_g1_i1:396-881(-)
MQRRLLVRFLLESLFSSLNSSRDSFHLAKEVYQALSTLITGSTDSQARLKCLWEEFEEAISNFDFVNTKDKRTFLVRIIHTFISNSGQDDGASEMVFHLLNKTVDLYSLQVKKPLTNSTDFDKSHPYVLLLSELSASLSPELVWEFQKKSYYQLISVITVT